MSDPKQDKKRLSETLKVEGKFDIMHYAENVNLHSDHIQTKISDFEIKITSLKTKEKIISDIIDRANNQIGKFFSDGNFAKAQGMQNALITQFETYCLMQDMILKYESNIQSYMKMSLDIEKNKVDVYIKIKNADKNVDKDDDAYSELNNKLSEILNGGFNGQGGADFKAQMQKELQLEGY